MSRLVCCATSCARNRAERATPNICRPLHELADLAAERFGLVTLADVR